MRVSRGIAVQHSQFNSKNEMLYLSGLRKMFVRCGNSVQWTSWCSGSGIEIHVLDALATYWKEFGIHLPSTHASLCECNQAAQTHLRSQFSDVTIFDDVNQAAEYGKAKDIVTNQKINVSTTSRGLIAGFSCTSRSPKNSKAKENLHCIQTVTRHTHCASHGFVRFAFRALVHSL